MSKIYRETFDEGPAGWWGWGGNHIGLKPLPVRDSFVETISPWWIDYNHAPPGAGYLHMLFCLNTKGPFGEQMQEVAGPNRFVQGGFSSNLENTEIRLRIRGELESRGAQVVLLVQGQSESLTSPWALTSQPIPIGKDWRDVSLFLRPDEREWTCLRGRHDRQDYYGHRPLDACLRDVNCNLMLIFFPLEIAPMFVPDGDPHILRPERDYPVWRSHLPEGRIQMDSFEIYYP